MEMMAAEVAVRVMVRELREAVPVKEEMVSFVKEEGLMVGSAEMLRLREERVRVPLVGLDVRVRGVVDRRVGLVIALVLLRSVVGCCRVELALVLVSSVVGCREELALVLVSSIVGFKVTLAPRVLAALELAAPPPLPAETIVQEVAAPFPSRTQVRGCGRVGVQARLVKLWRYLLARKVKRVFPTPGSGVAWVEKTASLIASQGG